MISKSTIELILSRLDIVEIVGSFVKLKKRGSSYLGLCPFHNEKTPSFTVSASKEIYKCFGCGRSGNTVSFLMEHEKYSYVEALRWLANKYNVEIEETEVSPEVIKDRQIADSLYIINTFAQKFFSESLFKDEEGITFGLSYLKERGFNPETIHKFQIGYSPRQKDAFATEALKNQFNKDLLLKSGIVSERNNELIDTYRERIIFPIHNITGKIIGFGARIIGKKDNAPKYINTPENEVYIKSKILYGTYFARQSIDKSDECLLVEGYTDVVSLHQAGIENVVASGGTSLTPDQLRLIKKYTNNLTILYDGDSAGVKAALRGLDLALDEGLNVKVVLIPDNEDPDSFVNKIGAKAFKEFVNDNKKDIILFQLEVLLRDVGNDSIKKANVVNVIAESISRLNRIEDFTKRQDYIKICSSLLNIDERDLTTLINKLVREKIQTSESKFEKEQQKQTKENLEIPDPEISDFSNETYSILHQDRLQERAVVRVLLEFGLKPYDEKTKVADFVFSQHLDDDLIEDDRVLKVMQTYKNWFDEGRNPTTKDFMNLADSNIVNVCIEATNFPYELSKKWHELTDSGPNKPNFLNLGNISMISDLVKRDAELLDFYYDEEGAYYKQETKDVTDYIKLRKLRKMILMNQEDIKQANDRKETIDLLKVHLHIKEIQMRIGKERGIVYYPF